MLSFLIFDFLVLIEKRFGKTCYQKLKIEFIINFLKHINLIISITFSAILLVFFFFY